MSKQDRQGVRTPADIERKYDLGKDYSSIEKLATNANNTAASAKRTADNAVSEIESLTTVVEKNTEDIAELDKKVEKIEVTGGIPGDDGATFTPSVDSAGNLSWTNDQGLPNPATVNIKGAKGNDGYTPVKGVDYFDGQNGKDGAAGKDGVSATHSWNGTKLTITSASGSSTADLKGEKGDKGDTGTFDSSELADYAKVTYVDSALSKKANDYTIELYNGTGGNPKPVRFATVNYSACDSNNGVSAKIGMVSGHGNGVSYVFLQDAIINVAYNGTVTVDNFKYYGAETATYDGAIRQYGDIFWIIDTTNKIVDFYCLMGQYSRLNMTPWKRMTYSSKGTVTQYTSCTVYSSGTKAWANNSEIALVSDIPANSNTTYTLTKSGTTITLTGSDGSTTSVTDADTNTVYTHPSSHPASMITGLATVATSGSYNDLSNKPTIPAAYTHPSSHPASMITGLATVATSGSYNDLSNKPTIPAAITVDSALSSTSTNPVQNKVINSALAGKAASSHGNHVPTTETANNARFLRNDNTWQTVTPANIGAAAESHSHSYLPLSGGTLTGELRVNGGDAAGGSKFVLETGKGQITNSGTQTLLVVLTSTV